MAAPFKTRKGVLKSSGAGDAGKVPLLNAKGLLDLSFFAIKGAQRGTGIAPNSGTHSTTQSITFPTAFPTPPIIIPVLRQAQICQAGVPGTIAVSAKSETAFTVVINTNVDDTNAIWNINVAPVFDWVALLISDTGGTSESSGTSDFLFFVRAPSDPPASAFNRTTLIDGLRYFSITDGLFRTYIDGDWIAEG